MTIFTPFIVQALPNTGKTTWMKRLRAAGYSVYDTDDVITADEPEDQRSHAVMSMLSLCFSGAAQGRKVVVLTNLWIGQYGAATHCVAYRPAADYIAAWRASPVRPQDDYPDEKLTKWVAAYERAIGERLWSKHVTVIKLEKDVHLSEAASTALALHFTKGE